MSKRSGRYDRRSVQEYEDEGLAQAIDYFRNLRGTYRPDMALADDVRLAIDGLPAEAVLQVTMSDFWLRLTKDQGQVRRKNAPPPNPFVKQGRTSIAAKHKIQAWDLMWRMQDVTREFAASGSAHVRKMGRALQSLLPWLLKGPAVAGCAADIPHDLLRQLMSQSADVSMKWMTLERALRTPWCDMEEHRVWFLRFEMATDEVLSDVRKLFNEHVVPQVDDDPMPSKAQDIRI